MYLIKKLVLLLLFALPAHNVFSCLGAEQLKTFPIGIYEGNIITIDIEILRTESNTLRNANIPDDAYYMAWVLQSHISIYDLEQNLISTKRQDSVVIFRPTYIDKVTELYKKSRRKVLRKYRKIELLQPKNLTFYSLGYFEEDSTAFPKKRNINVLYDSLTKEYSAFHQQKKYSLPLLTDSTHYFIPDDLDEYRNTHLYPGGISSMSTYTSKNYELIIIHLQGGMGMGISMFENRKKYEEAFSKPKNSAPIYEEVLFPHAFGVDVFLAKKK
ncbi:hypothetical protein [Bernardetia sp.]|uniref:hypothetical protein n=1 Tax=Bernardetia sp. TaxID=1937974 RepID=UPI0025C2D499|nr:hypothetical protein [Bernardetia sp.]